jgi:hypothetical protein
MKPVVVAVVVALGLSSTVLASSLTTEPFPGVVVGAGSAFCFAENLGTSTDTVTLNMINDGGAILDSTTQFVGPGASIVGGMINPAVPFQIPVYCSFAFKGRFKGSFAYVGPSGTPIVVIPATK